jgi:uncharacterized membrane protein YfcA
VTEVVVLCGFAFLAGLVDAIAGGGGLIQVPALFAIFPSLPPSLLLGTNKFSAITGTTIATLRYGWSIPIQWRSVVPAAVVAGLSAVGGARTVTLIDPAVLRPLLLIMLSAMAIYTLARPALGQTFGTRATLKHDSVTFYGVTALFGFYDGFFGPGAGSVMMFVLVRLFGHDFLSAAATTKVLNLATNFGALVLFMMTGNVLYAVALPMAAFNVCGGFLGAHFAVRGGSRFVRIVFIAVVVVLIGKSTFDLLNSF